MRVDDSFLLKTKKWGSIHTEESSETANWFMTCEIHSAFEKSPMC